MELAKDAGAKRAIRLPVSGAFHSPLMTPASASFAHALEGTAMTAPSHPVYANVTAEPVSQVAIARELYARAYEPVHRARTLEALEQQRALLGAADALEKRATAIHEWPFTERTPTVVITVATSVTAMTIGRLILDPLGL